MTDKRIKEPCPFCGCKAKDIQIIEYSKGSNRIECPNCYASFTFISSKQAVIDSWNRRYR